MATRKRKSIEDHYILYDDLYICAKDATRVFLKNHWCWQRVIPSELDIIHTLQFLRDESLKQEGSIGTGRLIYYNNKYGYLKSKFSTKAEVEKSSLRSAT